MKRSVQREAILEELRAVTTHPTADELYELLRVRMPRISLATVYRNLEQLAQAGIVLKLAGGGNQKRFDGNIERHAHRRCTVCEAVCDLDTPELRSAAGQLEVLLPKLESSSFLIEFSGECRECKNKRGARVS